MQIKLIGMLCILVIIVTGCNSKKEEINQSIESVNDATVDTTEAVETVGADYDSNTYPLPIMDGWEEIDISFETIGGGSIDVWHGEFSFVGEIDDYFGTYQKALADAGFDVTITQDVEGMKSLSFEQIIDGDNYAGNTLFNDEWVKSSLQHFK